MKGNSLGGRTIGRRRFLAESSIALVSASTGLGAFGRTAAGRGSVHRGRNQLWPSAGRAGRGPRHVQRHPVRRLRLGSQSFQGRATAAAVDGCTRSLAAWRSVDAAEPKSAERTAACRGLPLPERLDAGGRRTQAPGHVLQPRRRLHDRFGWSRLPGWEQPCAHVGRRGRRDEPQARSHGLLVPWPPGRGGIRHVGQPGPLGYPRWAEMGLPTTSSGSAATRTT